MAAFARRNTMYGRKLVKALCCACLPTRKLSKTTDTRKTRWPAGGLSGWTWEVERGFVCGQSKPGLFGAVNDHTQVHTLTARSG